MLAIHNFKVIFLYFAKLQTLLQSYQNVSNSQRQLRLLLILICCKRFCKVIKMLAIHNLKFVVTAPALAANAFAKLSKCQQFTTTRATFIIRKELQTLLQSYQNVSNSQLDKVAEKVGKGCKRFCKVIKMLAIHNRGLSSETIAPAANAFAKLSKCQQFTTWETII